MGSQGNSFSAEDCGRTEGEGECLEPVDVNSRTLDLLDKTDISVLRGKEKVKLLSSCRLCQGTQRSAVPAKSSLRALCSGGCRGGGGTGRGQELVQKSLDRASSFSPSSKTMVE